MPLGDGRRGNEELGDGRRGNEELGDGRRGNGELGDGNHGNEELGDDYNVKEKEATNRQHKICNTFAKRSKGQCAASHI